MTVHRRPLVFTAAVAFLFPACISITARPEPITPPEMAARIVAEAATHATQTARKSDFAVFPARPGQTVAIKPPERPKDATTAQKQPAGADAHAPIAPPSPGNGVTTAADPPGPFPLVASRPPLPESPLLTAVRAHIENRPERAIEAIGSLTQSNQDFVLAVLPVLVRGTTMDLAGGDQVALAVMADQLRSAAARLESHAALRVDAALFCEKVYAFGRYTPWPKNQPYRPTDKAQFYIEVRNLGSQAAAGPHGEPFLTLARGKAVIHDAKFKRVPHPDPANYRRRVEVAQFEERRSTRTPLHDFHLVYTFPVPDQPGVYTITVELSDASGLRTVKTAPVEFTVAGP